MEEFILGLTQAGKTRVSPQSSEKKIRYAAGPQLRKLFPVLEKQADPKFEKAASGFSYAAEIAFVIFSALIIIEIFVNNPRVLLGLHSARALAFLIIAVLTAYSISRGISVPEVRIQFYFVELLIILGINIAALIVQSIRFSGARKRGELVTFSGVITFLIPAAMTLFNFYLLGQQIYRFRLGKRTTPINSLFTLLMSGVMSVMSMAAVKRNYELL